MLLGKGARLDCIDSAGTTPLHLAVLNDNFDVADLLLQANHYQLHFRSGSILDCGDSHGNSALHIAALLDKFAMVVLHLRAGANACKYKNDRLTPTLLSTGGSKTLLREIFAVIHDHVHSIGPYDLHLHAGMNCFPGAYKEINFDELEAQIHAQYRNVADIVGFDPPLHM